MVDYIRNIEESRLSIYDYIDPDNRDLYIPTYALERILSDALVGLSLFGLKLRTRSKVVKTEICRALGYPVPNSFRRTQPRFPGQNFDEYTQKSRNVQIWNEEVDANRRYVFVGVDQDDTVTAVRAITGEQLASYDRTGTLTRKYQARMQTYGRNICSSADTETVRNWIVRNDCDLRFANPNYYHRREQLLGIKEVYKRLLPMIGASIDYIDAVQERNRGAELHAMICDHLGYSIYEDDGTYGIFIGLSICENYNAWKNRCIKKFGVAEINYAMNPIVFQHKIAYCCSSLYCHKFIGCDKTRDPVLFQNIFSTNNKGIINIYSTSEG